ncbi:MAG: DNA polymerase I [Bacteroidales bacterium]
MNKLILIDGHALIFRTYYAFIKRPMINSKGEDTSIFFGFMKYLLELIKREHPTHIAVAFDPPCKTFRHKIYPEYKGNRNTTPELVKAALDPLVELVEALNIKTLMVPGYEADDVIGAYTNKIGSSNTNVYMVTPDKDYGQLITDHVFQVKPGRASKPDEIVDKKTICEKFNIQDPKQIIDILAIWGDAADNIFGVKGIGEVGAKKLVGEYGNLENIIANKDKLSEKQRTAFINDEEQVKQSKFLVTIKTDIDNLLELKDFKLNLTNNSKIRNLFNKYELKSLFNLLPSTLETEEYTENLDGSNTASTPPIRKIIQYTETDLENVKKAAKDTSIIAIHIEKDCLYLAASDKVCKLTNWEKARDIFEDKTISKTGYKLKKYINILRDYGILLNGHLADIELIHYLINPEMTHKADILAASFLNMQIQPHKKNDVDKINPEMDLFSSLSTDENTNSSINEAELDDSMIIATTAAYIPIYLALEKNYESDPDLKSLYNSIEMPLIKVLADMEYEGCRIDTHILKELGNNLVKKLAELEKTIRQKAEEPTLNISSPKQLGIILFEKLNLDPKSKKNKNGNFSTDEETLSKIIDKDPIVENILNFRKIKKLLGTYIEPLPLLIHPNTGNIHTTFNQSLTATGRLSSSNPNLQNIPIRTDIGKEIRKAFVSRYKNGSIISADYSQIELRIMASLSGDKDMIEAFTEGKDIHSTTAAKIFNEDLKDVTSDQRRKAKTANFGIIYGISAFGLSQRLRIPRKEAKELIDEYFAKYPKIVEFTENAKALAREKGYAETIFHRKRYLPNILSRNHVVKSLAERNAVNAPIQGSAADLIKLAMIHIYKKMKALQLKSIMILQVHDELIFDVVPEEKDLMLKLVKDEMENVYRINVPLTVECSAGENWLEAH